MRLAVLVTLQNGITQYSTSQLVTLMCGVLGFDWLICIFVSTKYEGGLSYLKLMALKRLNYLKLECLGLVNASA